MRVTLADVAELAGVDRSTVSKVLAGNPAARVGTKTRSRIVEAAKELNYQPNGMARALRTRSSRTLGLVLPQLDNPVFNDMVNGVEAAARAQGYSILICRISGPSAREAILQMINTNQVDGVLIISFDSDGILEEALTGIRVPVVMINRCAVSGEGYVVHDSFRAAELATSYLLNAGHTRILHLAGRHEGYNGSQRLAGYRSALEIAGIAFDPSLVLPVGYDPEIAAQKLGEYLAMLTGDGPHPTALFASTLITAAGAVRTLHEQGYDLPRDFSVIALNDGLLASLIFPKLTTVALQSEKMGSHAATMLINQLSGNDPLTAMVLEPGSVIERNSVTVPSQGRRRLPIRTLPN